jgi:hypothetical protein
VAAIMTTKPEDEEPQHEAKDSTTSSSNLGPSAENNSNNSNKNTEQNPKNRSHQTDSSLLHRRRTLYLVRHGEAVHNVLEAKAQAQAKAEAQARNLSPEETQELMEERRKAVLEDTSLRDAPLTDNGREQARKCAARLQQLIDEGKTHPPTEAMV